MDPKLKPGDHVTVSRDGKIFLTQYSTLSGFASVSRTLGPDPETEFAELQQLVDRLWAMSALRNHAVVNDAYSAMGQDGDIEALIGLLESKVQNGPQKKTLAASPVRRKKHLGSS